LVHPQILGDAALGAKKYSRWSARACSALSFADTLPLVKLRGQYMERVYPRSYGVAAIDERLSGVGAHLYRWLKSIGMRLPPK
jgi:hypothetical protein